MSTLIRDGHIVTMNAKRQILRGDLRFDQGEIREIGKLEPKAGEAVVNAAGAFVIPGLIQTHTHLIQTLFRGWADDLELLDWLQKKIWPFEKAHNETSARAAARLGLLEMQLLGTTSILDMGTVRLHESVFAEAEASGMRYWGGNCLMDLKSSSGPLYRETEDTLAYCEELIQEWHNRNALIQYAISPRFVISCTEKILKAAVELQAKHGLLFHTHASENKGEVALVKKRTGLDNVRYLKKIGCLNPSTVIAHAIHLGKNEITDLARAKAGVSHCPSSNLKLASGVANITEYLKRGVKVGIGADGAPCNNMMDPFMEMRLAALLQKPIFGPTALPAQTAFELATVGGAAVLNASKKIGSLEKGKRADIVLVQRTHPSCATVEDPYSALVYSCSGRDVSHVWIEGRPVVADYKHKIFDSPAVIENARVELSALLKRAKVTGSQRPLRP
jgi:5-methylthioadenosine/S-adenosylhomocysteine deaminase